MCWFYNIYICSLLTAIIKQQIKAVWSIHNIMFLNQHMNCHNIIKCLVCGRGGSKGGVHPARDPPPKIGKNIIVLRKIVIFHTKYPKKFRTSFRSVRFFLSAPPLTWNLGYAPVWYMKQVNDEGTIFFNFLIFSIHLYAILNLLSLTCISLLIEV